MSFNGNEAGASPDAPQSSTLLRQSSSATGATGFGTSANPFASGGGFLSSIGARARQSNFQQVQPLDSRMLNPFLRETPSQGALERSDALLDEDAPAEGALSLS